MIRVKWALAMAFGLNAASAFASGWWSGTVSQIEVDSTGAINAYLGNTANNECGSNRALYVHSLTGNDDAKAVLASLLAWQAQGNVVQFYISACNTNIALFTAAYNQ